MGLLENTPLGCRLVFGLCGGYYLVFLLEPHLLFDLHVVCRPKDVIYGWQVPRLLLASFAHSSLLGLLLAGLVSWRRFAALENRAGTTAFLTWFVMTSLIVHSAYCLVAVLTLPFLGDWLMNSEVHGLYPVLVANLVSSIKDTDNSSVWLWPLPFYVSTRNFPLVVMTLSWLLHMDSHLDVSVAYFTSVVFPDFFEESEDAVGDMDAESLQKLQVRPFVLLSDRQDWLKSLQAEAPKKTRQLRRLWADAFRQQLQSCRMRAVQVLSTLGTELAEELEAALFLQLGDAWAADCVREDVEDTMHVRRCKGCLCFASRFSSLPDEPPAARAQRLLEGFPKPPQPPQPAQPVSQGEDAIEDFPEDLKVAPKAAAKRRKVQAPKGPKAKAKRKKSVAPSKAQEPGQSQVELELTRKQRDEAFLWQSGCPSTQQKFFQTPVFNTHHEVPANGPDGNLWMQSQGCPPCSHPQANLLPQNDPQKSMQAPVFNTHHQIPANGPDGNLWMQSQGCTPCSHPQANLLPQNDSQKSMQAPVFNSHHQVPANGPDGNLWMQSQGCTPCSNPQANLLPQNDQQKSMQAPVFNTHHQVPSNGPDGNLCIQSEGCVPSVNSPGNSPSCRQKSWQVPQSAPDFVPNEGNLWMHPQQSPSQGNMPLPAFKSTTSHVHDKKEKNQSEDDAMARGCAPDAAAVPLPTSLRRPTPPAPKFAEPMTPVRSTRAPPTTPAGKAAASPAPRRLTSGAEVLAEISRILAVPAGASSRWAQQVLRLEGRDGGAAASKAFRRIAREIHPDGRLPLSEEDEIRCHEALAQLQRARRRLCGQGAQQRPPKRPERLRCEVRNAAWYITWQRRDDAACGILRYELRVQDGSFLVTVAELDAASDASCGFELRREQLSQRLLQLLQANGWLGIRVAALGAGGCSLSDEATLWLRELTEAGSKFNLSGF